VAEADCLITGDDDLLVLDPFRGLRISTARACLGAR
jgi:predicted nucleic acid-binding protein